MYKMIVSDVINSGHFLRNYEGKQASIHGHSFKIEVEICAEALNKYGAVANVEFIQDVLHEFDSQCFNSSKSFKEINPTPENIARYYYDRIMDIVSNEDNEAFVSHVKIKESDNNTIVYIPDREE